MRLAGRAEIGLDPHVYLCRDIALLVVRPEPAAPARMQRLRFLHLRQAERADPEPSRRVLAIGRAGHLDMVQRGPCDAHLRATTNTLRNGSTTPRPSSG